MRAPSTSALYGTYARFYDAVFGPITRRRIGLAVQRIPFAPGQRILDLGVGTGLSLDFYPRDVEVVGVDLSGDMLRQARRKVESQDLSNVRLARADALRTPFADASFDHTFVSHVLSVTGEPFHLLEEVRRITRPGGYVVVVNHFRNDTALVGRLEQRLMPLFVQLGWKTELSVEDMLEGSGLKPLERFRMFPVDLWEIVVMRNGDVVHDSDTRRPAGSPIGNATQPSELHP